ncbi:Putative adhesin domain-containing protein OS=Lysinibacillus sphaericus OX=1421 GN=LS41612_19465 PE=4 SV=1 [Lysinibacillus sphaericus]
MEYDEYGSKKSKRIDVSSPFGDNLKFTHTEELAAAHIENIMVELPNGNFY